METSSEEQVNEAEVDPVMDIIDYLVRCANISFKNSHVNEQPVRTNEKILMAYQIYKKSPTDFLMQFGKYLTPNHIKYFEKISKTKGASFKNYVLFLNEYHSESSKRKRIRNRRYKALQRMKNSTDYFSEKEMMFRNPLLYEQLVGQYLTDEEIKLRDTKAVGTPSFLNIVLETVDHNHMREIRNVQMVEEDVSEAIQTDEYSRISASKPNNLDNRKKWGEFTTPDTKPNYIPEKRKQKMISAPERELLHEEFIQEMYNSFINGNDMDFDYTAIDNDEQYDDLEQESQDAQDKYFDSETNEVENLEEHMRLVEVYGQNKTITFPNDDPLDVFMKHIRRKC